MENNRPLKSMRFRMGFVVSWLLWTSIHAFLLNWYGLPWSIASADSMVSNVFLSAASFLIFTVLQYYLPRRNRYGHIIILCAVFAFIWFLATRSILVNMFANEAKYLRFFSFSVPIRLSFAILTLGCMALAAVLWYTIEEHQEIEKRKVEAEALAKEAELFKLRQQLQPHFMFNSLNSINALIGIQPERARAMVQYLSEFLRRTLKKEDNQWVSIDDELQHLQLYLEIEKVRFGHRLQFMIERQLDGGSWLLPSMLLQPVLENAVKFGLYGTTGEIIIRVKAYGRDNLLQIQVTNPFDASAHLPKGTGFGLSSVRRRLFLLFARYDLIETHVEAEEFFTTLTIPQPG